MSNNQIDDLDRAVNGLLCQLEMNLRQFCRLNDEIYQSVETVHRIVRQIKKEASNPTDQGTFEATAK